MAPRWFLNAFTIMLNDAIDADLKICFEGSNPVLVANPSALCRLFLKVVYLILSPKIRHAFS
jgi:hypothetical protein